MKRWFFALIYLVCLALPLRDVQAQTPIEIEQLQIDIWPEYDRPEVLVIYHIVIAANSPLPAQVSLRIPRAAQAPFNVAMKDVDGMLYVIKYDQVTEGDWLRITFMAASTELQVEYYDPALVINGSTHQYTYQWPGDYRVRNMNVRIQQPFNASGMRLTKGSLKIDSAAQGEDNLMYYSVPIDGVIGAGTSFDVPFSYTKNDALLSSDHAPVQAVKTAAGAAALASGSTPPSSMIWVGLAIGAVLILLGIVWGMNQRRLTNAMTTSSGRRRHLAPSNHLAGEPPVDNSQSVYCHQCGKRASQEDAFCRSCGTRLRQ